MSRKKSKRTNKPANSSALKPAMHHYLQEFQEHFDNRRYAQALAIANRLIDTFPKSPEVWELKANALGNLNRMREASDAMATSCSLLPHQNTKASIKYAQYLLLAGFAEEALKVLLPLHKYEPRNVKVWTWTSRAYHVLGRIEHALDANDKACDISPNDPEALLWRSRIMDQAKRPTEARKAAVKLKGIAPARLGVSNHIASLDLREGLYESAEQHFNDELKLQDNSSVATNLLVAKHYNPTYTVDDIYKAAREWQNKYVNSDLVNRASTKKYSNKRVRIGLLSGSFRIHPVGQMILPALQNLDNRELELFAYSTNQTTDKLTQRIKKCVNKWVDVAGLNEDELDNQIRQDGIDILIDLNGGGEGSRYQVISREPAPLIVKWVGMLINTTGLDCFDYLLSDGIETPLNVDKLYTEKLIRLPDDYVCYHIPDYIPDVNGLPALKNGYITFGCLNNPAKLSPPLIKEWADLLKEIPNSKLLLRGIQFEGEEFCKRMESRFFEHGIDRDRLILQGPARHQEFLTTYQSIDIALDTWPYSGGLTTCEALAMGVPVVTCVGPTFAGRHSATHLANAGLPELVTDNWEDFRKRAKELASDLPNLAVIRAALRTILKESPVCDGARFAKNFTKAMRGIWQRHCEGKAPEALTFNKEGDAWFAGEEEPVTLAEVDIMPEPQEAHSEWKLDSPIMVIDNGARFARQSKFAEWMQTGNFAVITFDPGSLLTNRADELKRLGDWHHYPHATLGDGNDATLYATLDPEQTGTLEPLEKQQTKEQDDPLRVLSTLPISTVPLQAIEGLPGVDLLVIDDLNNSLSLLNNSGKYLEGVLVIDAKIKITPTHKDQLTLECMESWAYHNDFKLYDFYISGYDYLLEKDNQLSKVKNASTILATYVRVPEKLKSMTDAERAKLRYILNSVCFCGDRTRKLENFVDKSSLNFERCRELTEGIQSPTQAKAILELINSFSYAGVEELRGVVSLCEERMRENAGNNAAFFILVNALLKIESEGKDLTLIHALRKAGWEEKYNLYSHWLKNVIVERFVEKPICSVIVISNKYKDDVFLNIQELRRQGGEDLEIVFVNNGADSEDFGSIKSYVDIWVDLKFNSGAYLARNIGSLFSHSDVLLFVDDDGFPEENFVQVHVSAHANREIACLRGVCRDSSGKDPAHYNLGDIERASPPTLEGNVSFNRQVFMHIGGWGDYILFGHGGLDISVRLFSFGYGATYQRFTPLAILRHDYLRGNSHAKQKIAKQTVSGLLLDALHGGLSVKVKEAFSTTVAPSSKQPYAENAKPVYIPTVTFPAEVKNFVLDVYKNSSCILEYGSGGSTLLAASLSDKKIFAVENDSSWAENMVRVFEKDKYPSPPKVMHVDIGETAKWAKPKNDNNWKQYPLYSMKIWDEPDFTSPDTVLIDGRLRTSCLLAVILKAKVKTTVLFDDYRDRKYYHVVEKLIKPVRMIGRMAVFEVDPLVNYISKDDWLWVIEEFYKVTMAGKDSR